MDVKGGLVWCVFAGSGAETGASELVISCDVGLLTFIGNALIREITRPLFEYKNVRTGQSGRLESLGGINERSVQCFFYLFFKNISLRKQVNFLINFVFYVADFLLPFLLCDQKITRVKVW